MQKTYAMEWTRESQNGSIEILDRATHAAKNLTALIESAKAIFRTVVRPDATGFRIVDDHGLIVYAQ